MKKKKYIIITFSIVEAGGAQLYVRNKIVFLKQQGWDVFIYSADNGAIRIKELVEYKDNIIREIGDPPQSYTKDRRNVICQRLLQGISKSDDVVIESHSNILGLWGELLAKKANGIHLLYTLEERNTCLSKTHLDYLKFKWQQRAYVGITPLSLKAFFAERDFAINLDESYSLPAYCNNPVEEIDNPFVIHTNECTICLFGRLDKLFIFPTAEKISKYIKSNPTISFTIVVIGGGNKETIKKLASLFDDVFNCNYLFTGYLYPIPYDLLRQIDICVSSAGCCYVTQQLGIVTIPIDANDFEPIGILGYTTEHSLFREDEPRINLEELMDLIVKKKLYKTVIKPFTRIEYDYSIHLAFIDKIINPHQYYEINNIRFSMCYIMKCKIKRQILKLIGEIAYRNISSKLSS